MNVQRTSTHSLAGQRNSPHASSKTRKRSHSNSSDGSSGTSSSLPVLNTSSTVDTSCDMDIATPLNSPIGEKTITFPVVKMKCEEPNLLTVLMENRELRIRMEGMAKAFEELQAKCRQAEQKAEAEANFSDKMVEAKLKAEEDRDLAIRREHGALRREKEAIDQKMELKDEIVELKEQSSKDLHTSSLREIIDLRHELKSQAKKKTIDGIMGELAKAKYATRKLKESAAQWSGMPHK